MEKCQEINRWLPGWAANELGDGERRQVAEHLAGCPACAEEAREYGACLEALRRVKQIAPRMPESEATWSAIESRLLAHRAPFRWPLAITAAAAVLVATVVLVRQPGTAPISRAPALAATDPSPDPSSRVPGSGGPGRVSPLLVPVDLSPPDASRTPAPIRELVEELGSDDFSTRERATVELGRRGEEARSALERALTQNHDPQVRIRASRLLRQLDRQQPEERRPFSSFWHDFLHNDQTLRELEHQFQDGGWPRTPLFDHQDKTGGRQEIEVRENGNTYRFRTGADGKITMETRENKDGKVEEQKIVADSVEALREKYPALYRKYRDQGGLKPFANRFFFHRGFGGMDREFASRMRELFSSLDKQFEDQDHWSQWRNFFDAWRVDQFDEQEAPGLDDALKEFSRQARNQLGQELGAGARTGSGSQSEMAWGLTGEQVDPALADQLGLPPGEGILLQEVVPAGRAAALGLQQFDILLEINGRKVGRTGLSEALADSRGRSETSMVIIRQGMRMTLGKT